MKKTLLVLLTACSCAAATPVSGTLFETVGQEYSIDPLLLYSISLTESGFKVNGSGNTKPWAWTLCYPGGSFYADTKEDAYLELARLKHQGIRLVDVGLMQINLHWNSHLIEEDMDVFDPLTNLRLGAQVLREALESTPSLARGVGRFHTWKDSRRQAAYAYKVLSTYKRLKGSKP